MEGGATGFTLETQRLGLMKFTFSVECIYLKPKPSYHNQYKKALPKSNVDDQF